MKAIKWEVLGKLQNSKTPSNKKEEIVNILLENRGIKKRQEREEFLNPIHPRDLTLEELKVEEGYAQRSSMLLCGFIGSLLLAMSSLGSYRIRD